MKIYYSGKFAREYKKLPLTVRSLAKEKEEIFRKNPFEPRLETHKLKAGLRGFWSFSINNKYRIIFEFVDRETIWFHSVGDHSIYKLWD